jgi:hypothetical protein
MAYEIPTTEPAELRAGDTVKWRKALTDYPASDGWVLSYRFINASNKYDVTAAADGDTHLLTIPAATSSAYVAGDYQFVSAVTKAGERFTVGDGVIKILPDLAAKPAGFDIRSTAKKTLELVNAALLAHGSKAWTQEYQVAGRTIKFTSPSEFMKFRSQLQMEVTAEDNAEGLQQGKPSKNKVFVRL